ncbi:MAG TPA: DUF2892 domain-containing protein [Bellilinea sp.]|nr:DUF2892 domain-containing protein [Bellilinea sp.]
MKKNVSNVERVIRVVLGIVLLYLAFGGVLTGVWVWVAGILGAMMLITGAFGSCWLYSLLGIGKKDSSS